MIIHPQVEHVRIGEIKIAKSPLSLQAILGSCVGIAFLWREKDIYGLAHCLLPLAPPGYEKQPARYVSQAIPNLIKAMNISPKDFTQIQVTLAGGADMRESKKTGVLPIGAMNGEAAMSILADMGLCPSIIELGGTQGRKIFVDTDKVKVTIEQFKKMNV